MTIARVLTLVLTLPALAVSLTLGSFPAVAQTDFLIIGYAGARKPEQCRVAAPMALCKHDNSLFIPGDGGRNQKGFREVSCTANSTHWNSSSRPLSPVAIPCRPCLVPPPRTPAAQ